jgi:acyl-CoA thioesterase I
MDISSKVTILFQGDSITCSGRRQRKEESLGTGYVEMLYLWLSAAYPELKIKVFNKGINGDKIKDLKNRWQKDFLNLKPDIISILVGINDVTGNLFSGPTPTSDFRNDFREILQATRDNIDGCRIILMTPFLTLVSGKQIKLQEDLNAKCEVIQELSEEFGALMIPLDKIFSEVERKRNAKFWTKDGFHPTPVGNALIAQSWLRYVAAANWFVFSISKH